jgi:hypothetical protein
MGARKHVGIGLSYRPVRLQGLAESIPGIDPWLLKCLKNTVSGIDFKESITISGSGSCYGSWFIEILMMDGGAGLYCIE